MESSEDDAGTATIASRRLSAREKDTEHTGNAQACSSNQQESTEISRSCETPAMSEDNFDGDSVPSPSTQDVNTSTEAILDMIDEFVEGPGAPKRLPLESVVVKTASSRSKPVESVHTSDNLSATKCESSKICSEEEQPVVMPESKKVITVENEEVSINSTKSECIPSVDNTVSDVKTESIASTTAVPDCQPSVLPESYAVSPSVNEVESVSSGVSTETTDPIPSSSAVDSKDNSECQVLERTVKCVTSSESNDNVTVESAESTCSESISSVPVTRSPLRRRLVRPSRPDTTVSSTVDVKTNITHPADTTPSDNLKDVSSSSDAVSRVSEITVEGSTQASNVSEVNVCKAETSVSTPKKIKLIRNKLPTPVTHSIQVKEEVKPQQCQSTSTLPEPSNIGKETSEVCSASVSSANSLDSALPIKDTVNAQEEQKSINISKPLCTEESAQVVSNKEECSISQSSESDSKQDVPVEQNCEERKVEPIKLSLSTSSTEQETIETNTTEESNVPQSNAIKENMDCPKQIPKLTIKLSNKQSEEMKSPVVPKVTIKPLRPPNENEQHSTDSTEQLPSIPKLTIKPIMKPPEKINDIHRKSSSSEISESESSENDDSASTSDQASASDQATDIIPKVTIKLGKPGTQTEGQFYTEKNIPKLTIKNVSNECTNEEESATKIKLKISQSEEGHYERIPKLTIKPITKSDSQSLSPKLSIKPLKAPESLSRELTIEHCEVPKLKITQESLSPKENSHMPKITIKPVLKTDSETGSKTCKKSSSKSDELDQIPVVTKINIKPIPKPTENHSESSVCLEDKVPVISKLNIKPVVKPKDCVQESSIDELPKITKLNIKPLKQPEEDISATRDCNKREAESTETCIPVVTKINIKPILKPIDHDLTKESEKESSETGNSSDDNTEQIPIVTKLNIKPIIKPIENEHAMSSRQDSIDNETVPVVTKLNIKPLVKQDEITSPSSPRKDNCKGNVELRNTDHVPIVTKLNIKPVVKPESDNKEEGVNKAPLVMKINMKSVTENSFNDTQKDKSSSNLEVGGHNNIDEIPIVTKINIKPIVKPHEDKVNIVKENCYQNIEDNTESVCNSFTSDSSLKVNCIEQKSQTRMSKQPENALKNSDQVTPVINCVTSSSLSLDAKQSKDKINEHHFKQSQKTSAQSCVLLKKLLEDNSFKKVEDTTFNASDCKELTDIKSHVPLPSENSTIFVNKDKSPQTQSSTNEINRGTENERVVNEKLALKSQVSNKETLNECISKPLEINTVSEKVSSSGQDSPRIILKINKTDHGASSEIITEEIKHDVSHKSTTDITNDRPKVNSSTRKKQSPNNDITNVLQGKRLRSSRIVNESEQSSIAKRNVGKKQTSLDNNEDQAKEQTMSALESKRLKLGTLLLNKSLTLSSAVNTTTKDVSTTDDNEHLKNCEKNSALLNNENCPKNGDSKLHKILSNLKARQMQLNEINTTDKSSLPEQDSVSTGSSDVIETASSRTTHEVHQMLINESSTSHDFGVAPDDLAQDPLEVDTSKLNIEPIVAIEPMTPQPKKRGRPRKIPLSEEIKPVCLPTPALEERPQRSLRLTRDRPPVTPKPRGRGRGGGRGAKRPHEEAPSDTAANVQVSPDKKSTSPAETKREEEIDPTSARIKLPRMTEALDKMPCSTPLSSRRRNSSMSVESRTDESDDTRGRGRGGRARGRGGRARGRGRGGGRGAVYMKETMGIYGRVCGPATTTVQLFEEETCMMDDNATPARPSHLLDEDSQSSVLSSTNDSSRLKKSKFADLFDSNKVWTPADVKEYRWPPRESPDSQVMMIQEQVAMFLGVKGFKRRYPELKRRPVGGEERAHVLAHGIVSEALCDLGITAVDASEVLDIMLSDYPHKYEEYRAHQRQKQLSDEQPEPEVRPERPDAKPAEPVRPEPPKVDPEKLKQELCRAASTSASEFNARLNAMRQPTCADLQTLTVHRRRPPPPKAVVRSLPAAGLYPLALLPGQYAHAYRVYTPEQLRYFPLNTALSTQGPGAESGSESEADWRSASSADEQERERPPPTKRKKLGKVKRNSVAESCKEEEKIELCRVCGLKEDANKKSHYERFLNCANCNTKLHPSCLELSADSARKCRSYAWQCADCKSCCGCRRPQDDDKMLFCDLCDRGFHIYCVGLDKVPNGRWHCTECAVCRSCGARDAPDWHHQTKRGPGGHKVYSHSLCPVCASKSKTGHRQNANTKALSVEEKSSDADSKKAYRIGRYCPLCERSFIGPKGTMQLVICKLCDRQLHQECVKQTVSNLNVLDYTCGECRRGGITSRAAAVRLAPRTIATLFMAKRRFNKYAHRQYLASRQRAADDTLDADDDTVDHDVTADDTADHDVTADDTADIDVPADHDVTADDTADIDVPADHDVTADDTADIDVPADHDVRPAEESPPLPPEDETASAVAALQMDYD